MGTEACYTSQDGENYIGGTHRPDALLSSEDDSTDNEQTSLIPSQKKRSKQQRRVHYPEPNGRLQPTISQEQHVNARRRRTRVTDHPDSENYVEFVRRAKRAISKNLLPELITQGSSGSYFVKAKKELPPRSQSE